MPQKDQERNKEIKTNDNDILILDNIYRHDVSELDCIRLAEP